MPRVWHRRLPPIELRANYGASMQLDDPSIERDGELFLSAGVLPGPEELLALYASVGWNAYTDAPDDLIAAVANSSYVVTARAQRELVGLARVIGDDCSIAYIQDVVVHPARQRTGVGRALVAACIERYAHVRAMVLMTDDEDRQLRFYESLGFANTRSSDLNVFVRFR